MKIFLRLFLCTRLDRESTVMLPSQKITIWYNLKILSTLRLLLVVFPIATHYGTVKLSQSHIHNLKIDIFLQITPKGGDSYFFWGTRNEEEEEQRSSQCFQAFFFAEVPSLERLADGRRQDAGARGGREGGRAGLSLRTRPPIAEPRDDFGIRVMSRRAAV